MIVIMLKSRLNQLLRRNDGATVIEYAMVLPVLLLFIMGILEYSIIMYANAIVEGSTTAAARLSKTGYNNNSGNGNCSSPTQSRSQYITCIVRSRLGGLFVPANITIVSKSYANFSQIGQPEPYTDAAHVGHYVAGDPYTDINGNGQWDADMGAAGLGGPGDIVVYTISYPWHVLTPIMQRFIGTNGIITLSSSAVIKNEPYPVSSR